MQTLIDAKELAQSKSIGSVQELSDSTPPKSAGWSIIPNRQIK